MSQSYFATGYIRLLYRLLRAEGLRPQAIFADTGYDETHLMQADFHMPFAAQMQLCHNALTLAAPGLGLRTGRQLQIAAHGLLGTAMQSAPNLQAALDTFAELIDSRASFLRISFEAADDLAELRISTPSLETALVPLFSETALFTLAHCIAFYSGRNDTPIRYRLSYAAPGYAAQYSRAFGAPPEFGARDTSFAFDASLLRLVSPEADPDVFDSSVLRCKGLMAGSQRDIVQEIQLFLTENPGRLWTVSELAPAFSLSKRTLLRRLKASGTSYQAVRDDFLKRQATMYLNSMSVEAAGLALGFADASSFRRSYKRWHGRAPTARH